MRSNFDASLKRLLTHEGGYTNHPSDPGGPTNFGITIADYRKYVKPGATASDVRAMNIEEAKQIYRQKYWDVQRCDDLPSGVDYAIFDYGVNSGVGRSGKVLRKVLKMDATTSTISPAVIARAKQEDATALVNSICDERAAFLRRLKTWPVFGKGWDRRVKEVRAAALAMAAKSAVPKPPDIEPIEISSQSKPAVKSKTLWASLAAGATTALGAIGDGLSDWRIWCAIIVLAILAYIVWERSKKPDISGIIK